MSNVIGSTVSDIAQSAAINNALLSQKDTTTQKSSSEPISTKKDNKVNPPINTNATTQVSITNLQGIAFQPGLYNSQGIVPVNKADNVVTSTSNTSTKSDYTVNANNSFVTAKTKWAKYTTADAGDKAVVNSNSVLATSISWSVDSSQTKNDNQVPGAFVAGIKVNIGTGNSTEVSSQATGASAKVEQNPQTPITHTSWGLFVEENKDSNARSVNENKASDSQKPAEVQNQAAQTSTTATPVMKRAFLKALANNAAQQDQMNKTSFQNFQANNFQSEQATDAFFANSNNTKQVHDNLTTQDYFSKKLNLTNLNQVDNTQNKDQIVNNSNPSQTIVISNTNTKTQINYMSDSYYKDQSVLTSKQASNDNSRQENNAIQDKKTNTSKELNQVVANSNKPGNNAAAILLNNFLHNDLS